MVLFELSSRPKLIKPSYTFDVSWNAICQLQALVDGDWGELDGTALLPETRQMVEKWGEYYLERPIRSMRLLD